MITRLYHSNVRPSLFNRSFNLINRWTSTSKRTKFIHPNDNELSKILSKVIEITGPIPLSSYMRQCLTHPTLGYYTSKDPLGGQGDFITSPEISQLFGEMIGIWFYSIWKSLDSSTRKINFIEFGPGKGTLMYDCLKIFKRLLKDNNIQINIIMIETSKILKRKQYEILTKDAKNSKLFESFPFWNSKLNNGEIIWCDTEIDLNEILDKNNNIDDNYNFIIAHEFFDALPINKFIKTNLGWRELLVDKSNDSSNFFLIQSPSETPSSKIPQLNKRYNSLPEKSSIEICPDLYKYSKTISNLIVDNKDKNQGKGAALIIDYGVSNNIPDNTLRGIKTHKFVNPFSEPGKVDLSADVDFQAIIETINDGDDNCQTLGPIDQGDWLINMGIQLRLTQLLQNLQNESERNLLISGVKRIVEKDENSMGKIYKFLGLVPQFKDKENVIPGFSK
ncbi:hypothetical protein WICMUC_002412 [Wickerhamomyces mucosus]|uniref:Protein arginine methyltransferase NDUFAF7 n=1 Tax=Wickerhamomyces mucosus TaxID=1378264 RepID=A0A9P8TEY7_9ASCO|nr:hypothetical protein WICMUC_002412 [Wickerhamomyces mucosus]